MVVRPPFDIGDERDREWARQLVLEHHPWMVAGDSLRRFHGGDENDSRAGAALTHLSGISSGRLGLVTHHLSTGGRLRGTTDFPANCDSTLIMKRSGKALKVAVEHHSAAPFSWSFHIEHGDAGMKFYGEGSRLPRRPGRSCARASWRRSVPRRSP